MIQFLRSIINWFTRPYNYQADVESYILSKRPTSIAEIEFWVKQYEIKEMYKGGWL